MADNEKLMKFFEELYEGKPFIDANFVDTLNEVTAKEAATKPFPNYNSIWESVNHVIGWRENVLKRMQNVPVETPEDNYFYSVRDRSEAAWQQTKENLAASQKQWMQALKKMKKKDLETQHEGNTRANYELVQSILEHDVYHLGQIRLTKKMVQLR